MTTKAGEPMAYLLAVLTTMPDCTAGRWPYSPRQGGYAEIRHEGRTVRVHHLVCTWYHGSRPTPQHQVRHLCGKGHLGCFSPCCVRWGTPAEQSEDKRRHGTIRSGENHGMAKLTAEQVAEIRRRYEGPQPTTGKGTGPTIQELADEYGVSFATIHAVVHRRYYTEQS